MKTFEPGCIVKCLDNGHGYGVVTQADERSIQFMHYNEGFGQLKRVSGFVMKADKKEFLKHYEKVLSYYDKRIRNGGLSGAVLARRKHELEGRLELIAKLESMQAIHASVPEPGTAVYVLMGQYDATGSSGFLEGLIARPRQSEQNVSDIMFGLRPQGFANIPGVLHSYFDNRLRGFSAFEVPDYATGFIPFPNRLERKGSKYRFIEG